MFHVAHHSRERIVRAEVMMLERRQAAERARATSAPDTAWRPRYSRLSTPGASPGRP